MYSEPPIQSSSEQPIAVHTLAGQKQIRMAVQCLGSLVRFSDRPASIVIHSDGSLTEEDKLDFLAAIPGSRFIEKRDADVIVGDALSKYPACARFRRTNILSRKLFDLALLSHEEFLAYSDTDILFFKPFRELFSIPRGIAADGIFSQDVSQAYSIRSTQLLRFRRLSLAKGLNSGLIYFRRKAFDLDLLEWFFKQPGLTIHPYWKEQTAWALLAGATNCLSWDSSQVKVITSAEDFNGELVAGHFTSSHRALMNEVPVAGSLPSGPVIVRSAPFQKCTPLILLFDELRRKRNRWFGL
jgi:hypothetical protein